MKWFDNWLYKKTKQAWDSAANMEEESQYSMPSTAPQRAGNNKRSIGIGTDVEHEWTENLNISITPANGGRIVSFRRYDRKTDRNATQLYVIPEEMDFNHELGKLITLEAMRG